MQLAEGKFGKASGLLTKMGIFKMPFLKSNINFVTLVTRKST